MRLARNTHLRSSPRAAPTRRSRAATTVKTPTNVMIARTVVVAAALALAACPTPIVAVKFGEDFTDTLKKKPEPLKGPTYARDFDGTQIFADDLSTMYMHGLTCGACMAVLNETKTLYDRTEETKFHHPDDVTGGLMYDYMHEATEPEEFCDGNVLGEKYGLNNITGHVAAAAWLRLRAVSQLRLHGQYEGTEMGKRAMMSLNEYRWAIDLGLLGYDLFSVLEEDEERFDPIKLAEENAVEVDEDDEKYDQKVDTREFIVRSLKTHPYRIPRQKMKLEQVCYDIVKSRPYIQALLHQKLRRDRHYEICHALKKCVWKTPQEVRIIEQAREEALEAYMEALLEEGEDLFDDEGEGKENEDEEGKEL